MTKKSASVQQQKPLIEMVAELRARVGELEVAVEQLKAERTGQQEAKAPARYHKESP